MARLGILAPVQTAARKTSLRLRRLQAYKRHRETLTRAALGFKMTDETREFYRTAFNENLKAFQEATTPHASQLSGLKELFFGMELLDLQSAFNGSNLEGIFGVDESAMALERATLKADMLVAYGDVLEDENRIFAARRLTSSYRLIDEHDEILSSPSTRYAIDDAKWSLTLANLETKPEDAPNE